MNATSKLSQRRASSRAGSASPSGYRLIERLGTGASAAVWRAEGSDGRAVALKVAHSRAEGPRLASEGLHASLALSPRLPELIDLGLVQIDGQRAEQVTDETAADALPFLALRWLAGRSLGEAMGDADDRVALALAAARDLAEAMSDLHGAGLAHGDVKPANALLEEGDRLALLDLGLTAPAANRQPRGATPRYLGQGDTTLGDGRARDLLALGLVLTEIAVPAVRRARRPLAAARRARVPPPLGRITAALLAPEPGARPSAGWVCELAASFAPLDPLTAAAERAGRARRRVRASYLALRWREMLAAERVAAGVAPWLAPALALTKRARMMAGSPSTPQQSGLLAVAASHSAEPLGPLDPERRQRWLVSLVGSAAASWHSGLLAEVDEPRLAAVLQQLAERRPPAAWTLSDLEAALDPTPKVTTPTVTAASGPESDGDLAPEQIARLTLGVAQIPSDPQAMAAVEQLGERAPSALRLAAADALRLAGQLGRARSLVLHDPAGGAIAADVLRRSGDADRARALCSQLLEREHDPDDRARACLARLELDAGQLAEAEQLTAGRRSAACAEVAARVAAASGHRTAALAHAQRGALLATGAEARARLAATVAFVQHGHDGAAARRGYGDAVAHAVRAGAVLEEASYRTGEAGACVYLGEIDTAIDTARRAALLWEDVLGRPAMAARAWLARAAAYASIDALHETRQAAEAAIERAEIDDDSHAVAYALWSIADASRAQDPLAARAATEAAALIDARLDDDAVRAAARVLRHAPDALAANRRHAIDATAAGHHSKIRASARLDWWAARAEQLCRPADAGALDATDGARVLGELSALAESPAAQPSLGKAMHTACALGRALGDTAALPRLDAARRAAAERVLAHCPGPLAEMASACAWLARQAEVAGSALTTERALDLQRLVRALGERENLDALLAQVIDALLLWTGAERGLLLLREPDGTLSPRAARGLGHAQLHGDQLTVSRSLAERALERGGTVVAVDAMAELSESHHSVHALGLRSVLVLPLVARGDTLGVAYLDDRVRRGAFGEREVAWARAVAPVAALAIADAATQVKLREALASAEQASQQLEQSLARKETALDVAERELARARSDRTTRFAYDEIIGDSEPMRQLLAIIDRVAPSDIAVLLRGESGSGKELLARAIHRASGRAAGPFVGENCGALPETLLESTLFGHVKGAFTSAHQPHVGLFEAADGGTLFLDEIGEMSLGMQTKLLRVLEDSLVRPVGATRTRHVNVRIVAATHRDLEQMVASGAFREDLYYRLNVISVRIPPLRERPSDIPLLVAHLVAKHAAGRQVTVTPEAMARLRGHPWPGNVRQLENEIRRALLLGDDVIDTAQLSMTDEQNPPHADLGFNVRGHIELLERELVAAALVRTGGNQTHAAKLLGLSRYGLHKMIKRLDITVDAAS